MVKQVFSKFAAVLALTAVARMASATSIEFVVDEISATPTGLSAGLNVDITAAGLPAAFWLGDGIGDKKSQKFDFLTVTVSGLGAAAGIIDATLGFTEPISGDATGVLGGFAVMLGLNGYGELTVLKDPGPIAFDGDGLFDVNFIGFKTTCFLYCKGTVQAEVTLLKAPTSAPEPATLSLLGAGLVALALSRRRRQLAA